MNGDKRVSRRKARRLSVNNHSYTCVLRHAHEGKKTLRHAVMSRNQWKTTQSIDSTNVQVQAFQSGKRGTVADVDEGRTLRLMRLLISLVKLRDVTYGISRLDTRLRKLRSTITMADCSCHSNLSLSRLCLFLLSCTSLFLFLSRLSVYFIS